MCRKRQTPPQYEDDGQYPDQMEKVLEIATFQTSDLDYFIESSPTECRNGKCRSDEIDEKKSRI